MTPPPAAEGAVLHREFRQHPRRPQPQLAGAEAAIRPWRHSGAPSPILIVITHTKYGTARRNASAADGWHRTATGRGVIRARLIVFHWWLPMQNTVRRVESFQNAQSHFEMTLPPMAGAEPPSAVESLSADLHRRVLNRTCGRLYLCARADGDRRLTTPPTHV
jgi:hypothetical protein